MEKYDNGSDSNESFDFNVTTVKDIKHKSIPTDKKEIKESIVCMKYGSDEIHEYDFE